MDALLTLAGQALAVVYVAYGTLALLLPAVFCLHLGVLICVALILKNRPLRVRTWLLFVELLYGFVNPVVYLLLLQPGLALPRDAALTATAWVLFAATWGTRLVGGYHGLERLVDTRVYIRGLLALGFLCLVAFLTKDLVRGISEVGLIPIEAWDVTMWQVGWGLAIVSNVGALYVIPAALVLYYLRATTSEPRWNAGRGFFLLRASTRGAAVAFGLVMVTVTATWYRPPAASVERLLLERRADIAAAAERHRIDPALVASIVYVTRRDHVSPFASHLERAAMGGWLSDLNNNFLLAQLLDVSIGLAQIKPLTAMTALVIHAGPGVPADENLVWAVVTRLGPVSYKEYRGVPRLGPAWRLPAAAVSQIRPPFPQPVSKPQVIEALFDDRQNLEFCALILALYAVQWESANPAWSLRRRPDILATLYQLGFEKSRPKADPRPTRFGDRVAEVYRSPWIQRHFGGTPGHSPSAHRRVG